MLDNEEMEWIVKDFAFDCRGEEGINGIEYIDGARCINE